MRCTGPYTRVMFDTKDAKHARRLIDGLRTVSDSLTVRHLPQGTDGLEDFALDADLPQPGDGGVWEIRAAKYLGPKSLLGHSHVYDAALRLRDRSGTLKREGYVFATSLKALGDDVARVLPLLIAGGEPDGLFSREDAEIHRVELCTGEPL